MAISAMHIVLESSNAAPATISQYMLAALEYHNAACQAFGNVGDHKTPRPNDDGETSFTTIFAFSIINLAFILGLPQCPVTSGKDARGGTDVVANVTMLFRVLQSVGSVISSDLDGFSKGPLSVSLDLFSAPRWREPDKDTKVALIRLRCIVERENGPQSSSDVSDRYSQAITWLEKCFSFYSDENRDVVLKWPMLLDMWFVRTLETGGDQVCWLIVLHWAVMLHWFGRGKRFTGDLGARLVDELSESMPGKDDLWEESIQYVRQQVGLQQRMKQSAGEVFDDGTLASAQTEPYVSGTTA
ncbi:hypothetical protein A1O7_04037 [Cladophialophora yegresii CBS 114405]|uniref:Transcription factor domain-containing protein n=1 Tax=Cladophialophora yegresii CBS 114405 TaxID=1182544 RepID=W9W4H6_9EURO|nr:uncharacterized protein A1O7_04037 [Cladophialophora yegresii CBS 114405]EXJ59890.1 hypothetical protein A1O7_04037 [Cladophialophora yegresii CBS 114405]